MRYQREEIDRDRYEFLTRLTCHKAKEALAFALRLQNDPDRKNRIDQSMCHCCFYQRGMLSGQMLTERQCSFCDAVVRSGNTSCGMICVPCAKQRGLCAKCGADITLKIRKDVKLTRDAM